MDLLLFCGRYNESGGIFGDTIIEPHEFTPRDIYQMDIYDKDFKKHGPKECLEADPELDYCMIYGKYDIRAEGTARFRCMTI